MRRVNLMLFVLTALTVVFVAACSGAPKGGSSVSAEGPSISTASSTTSLPEDRTGSATEDDLLVEVVAEDLEVPWEIRFLPDGALLVTERTGLILRIEETTGAVEELGRLPVAPVGEGGLLGVALDPDFPTKPHIYVMYTYRDDGSDTGLANRVSRLTLSGDTLGEEVVLVDGIPGAGNHDGGRVAFGPEGDLWVTTGDSSRGELALDVGSLAGKVLRMDREGRPATANPFEGSLVYSLGHRNPQGLAWLPGDPDPFVTEHGPSENDEVNHITSGGNFGWPLVGGAAGRAEFVDSIYSWTPTIAPAGAVFYESDAIPGWKGSFLFVTLKESDLRRLTPADPSFAAVADEQILLDGRFGRLRCIAVGPDGALYVGTSNRDGRGDPRDGDDKILRITAK
ncbi:MAG: PQQ-dependent sugar dehydrogenase [Thermoleophilia bacterium]